MNNQAMNNLTAPLLAAIDSVRAALQEANIPALNLRIVVTGRTAGDLNVQFKLCKDYDDDTIGSDLFFVVSEYIRRHNWNVRHSSLCLPNVKSEPMVAAGDEIPFWE